MVSHKQKISWNDEVGKKKFGIRNGYICILGILIPRINEAICSVLNWPKFDHVSETDSFPSEVQSFVSFLQSIEPNFFYFI